MEVKICPNCNEHNQVTARFCKRCDHELESVVITKIPTDETNSKNNNLVDINNKIQDGKEKSLLPNFVSRFMLGFFGWFVCISLILGIVFGISEGMGPSGIILVPFTFVPILATMFAIFLAFLKPIFRGMRVLVRKNGIVFGIIAAYLINFVMNLILNLRADPLAIVGSILGWPFYMIWLNNLF